MASFDFDFSFEQENLQLNSWVLIFSEFVFNFSEKKLFHTGSESVKKSNNNSLSNFYLFVLARK